MIIVMGTIRIPVENIEAARPVMTATVEATRAEDGCIAYAYAVDLLDPGLNHVTNMNVEEARARLLTGDPSAIPRRCVGNELPVLRDTCRV
jgi:hypothetical protein